MLIIKYPANRNTLYTLAANGFSRVNYNNASFARTFGRITAATPNGALGGMVAQISGDYEVDIFDTHAERPLGLFLNDAAGNAFENTPAVASGKLSVMTGPGSYETDIYETVLEAGGALPAWAVGQSLYVSNFGLLTRENTGSIVVGVVTKVPTANNVFLGFNWVVG